MHMKIPRDFTGNRIQWIAWFFVCVALHTSDVGRPRVAAATDTIGRITFDDDSGKDLFKSSFVSRSPWGSFLLSNHNLDSLELFQWEPSERTEGPDWLEWKWQADSIPAGFSEAVPGNINEQIDSATKSLLGLSFHFGIRDISKPRPTFTSPLRAPVNLKASQGEFDHKIELTWDNPNSSMPAEWGLRVYIGLTPDKENATQYYNVISLNPLPNSQGRESYTYPRGDPYLSLAPRWYFWVAYTHNGLEFVSENPEVWGRFRGAPNVPTMVWRAWPKVTLYHTSDIRDTAAAADSLLLTNRPPEIVIEQGVPLRYVLPSRTTLPGEILSNPPETTVLPVGTHEITVRLQPGVPGYSAVEATRTVRVVGPEPPSPVVLSAPALSGLNSSFPSLEFRVLGMPGLPFFIDGSRDLRNWSQLGGGYIPDSGNEGTAKVPFAPGTTFFRVRLNRGD
jgi:hypothetical protein